MFIKLYSLLRDGIPEVTHYGEIVVRGRRSWSTGEVGEFPARSCLKPFQFQAAGVERSKWLKVEPERFAACLGSTTATEEQFEKLKRWYGGAAYAARLEVLKVPPSFPMDENHRVHLRDRNQAKSRYFHMCFSKHMGILEGAVQNGWPVQGYCELDHPYHKQLDAQLKRVLSRREPIQYVTDGCGLPTPVLSLSELADLYLSLPGSETANLMRAFPGWIGGERGIDAQLMMQNDHLVAKVGADGLLAVAGLQEGKPFSVVLKLASGFLLPQMLLAVKPVLENLNLKVEALPPPGQTVQYHYNL